MKKIFKCTFTLIVVFLFSSRGYGHPLHSPEPPDVVSGEETGADWREMRSVEDLHSAYPERLEFLFEHLDLEREGLEDVHQAFESGDLLTAGRQLLEYYGESDLSKTVPGKVPSESDQTVSAADSIMQDIITIQGVADRVPRSDNGHLDWDHTGPQDDMEFAWLHNRHGAVSTLLDAWRDTGNPKYARHIDEYIKDWIISSWPYPEVKSSTAMWRGLEVSFRVKRWAEAFYQLMGTGYLSPATRLLLLSSIPEHAHYARNFHAAGNWLTMEISGLATAAAYWPEFKESSEWLDYSIDTMIESMNDQVYPDGVQTELTSSYHRVALNNFNQFKEICDLAGVSLPAYYITTLEAMWHYLAATMRPDGYGLLNNDADKQNNRDNILEAASVYDRKDWQYLASNGSMGEKPKEGPSFLFPWAGHLISRSDYGQEAHWSFFDIGPWGSGHQHNDKLHLSISAFGRDLLVDSGRFAYRGRVADRFRDYALGSQSHNLVLIDGNGQEPGPRQNEEPIPENRYRTTDEFDYASGSFDDFSDLEGDAGHTRSLFYVKGEFWVVVDHITTDRPRAIETLWHWHPETSVQESDNGVVSTDNHHGNLKIIPTGNTNGSIDFIKGQDEPVVQGWYSPEYNKYEPNTTTSYTHHVDADSTLIWVLFPSEETGPEVRAEVLSENSGRVDVRVSVPGKGSWNVSVPFFDSSEAGMEFSSGGH